MSAPPERNLLDKLRLRPALDWWRLEQQGQLLAIAHNWTQPEDPIGDKRGAIKGFTRSSRLRLLKTIARIDWNRYRNHLFITLTYPDDYWDRHYDKRTQQRDQFLRDAEREVGFPLACIWRVEWKVRQSGAEKGQLAPHQHHVLFGKPDLDAVWIAETWQRILGYPTYVHTYKDVVEGGGKVPEYVAKYCSKDVLGVLVNDAYPNMTWGRAWGIHRRALVPWAEQREAPCVPLRTVEAAKDMYAKIRDMRPAGGFTLFTEEAERLYERLVKEFGGGD